MFTGMKQWNGLSRIISFGYFFYLAGKYVPAERLNSNLPTYPYFEGNWYICVRILNALQEDSSIFESKTNRANVTVSHVTYDLSKKWSSSPVFNCLSDYFLQFVFTPLYLSLVLQGHPSLEQFSLFLFSSRWEKLCIKHNCVGKCMAFLRNK